MVQTIFSALWGQNQNRIKTNKNPPNSQKAAGRDARSLKEQTDPDGGDKGGTLVFNAHLTVLTTVVFSVIFIYRPDGGLKKWPCQLAIFPASTNLPFPLLPPPGLESLSFKKEVLLMMTGQGVKQDFQNTDFASLKALLHVDHTAQRQSSRQPDGAMTLTKQKKGIKNKTTPSLSFLKLKEKLRDGTASSGDAHS